MILTQRIKFEWQKKPHSLRLFRRHGWIRTCGILPSATGFLHILGHYGEEGKFWGTGTIFLQSRQERMEAFIHWKLVTVQFRSVFTHLTEEQCGLHASNVSSWDWYLFPILVKLSIWHNHLHPNTYSNHQLWMDFSRSLRSYVWRTPLVAFIDNEKDSRWGVWSTPEIQRPKGNILRSHQCLEAQMSDKVVCGRGT
jgi:hypothetical protein